MLKALFRRIDISRSEANAQQCEVISADNLTINTTKRSVHIHEERIELTSKEFDLQALLAAHPGHSYSREQLLNLIWGYEYHAWEHTVPDTKTQKMDKKMDLKMGMMKDCVMMKDGKIMITKKGNTMAMVETMTMSNGTMVMTDGTVKMKDGKTKMLKNDECVYMDGKMGMMKMHDKMEKKDPR